MKVSKLVSELNKAIKRDPTVAKYEVVIPIESKSTITGATSCITIDGISCGFDWNSGKVFLVSDVHTFQIH